MMDEQESGKTIRVDYEERAFPRDEDYGRECMYVMRNGLWVDLDYARKWDEGALEP